MELKDIIKPKNDTNDIKTCILSNKIKCVLIQDKNLDRSFIISSVNVGSLVDKEYYDGCAHLLEHLIFITSKKYQKRNYLQEKIIEFGGSTNAYTSLTETVYYLDVFNEHLEEILEIFIDFFSNAELNETYIYDELKNVNSEHNKNINNDLWRLQFIKNLISDKNTNYNIFSTGSSETLNKPDIQKKLKNLYDKYYIPENMSISIISNKPTTETYNLVNKYFSQIKNKNKIISVSNFDKPFFKNIYGNAYHIKSLNEQKVINYIFETPISNSKIFNILANIINSNNDYSLNNYLITNGFASNVSSNYENEGLFNIYIILTDFGFNNLKKIDGILKYTIDYLLNLDWKDICNYYKKIFKILFNNNQKEDTLNLGILLVNNTHKFKLEYIYIGNDIMADDINILKKYINFDKCIQILLSNNYDDLNSLIAPHYGILYKQISFINKNNIKFNLKLNLKNPYIDINPKFIKNLNNEVPILVNNIWFGNTSKFNETIVYCDIVFNNYKFYNTPKNYLLSLLSCNILNFYLKNNLNKAEELNYNAFISPNISLNQIILSLSFYNDIKFIQLYIDTVLNLITNKIKITDLIILSFIDDLKKDLLNISKINSIKYSFFILNSFYDNFHDNKILLKEINKISIKNIKLYLNNLFDKSNLLIYLYGNIKKDSIPKFNKINNLFNNKIFTFPTVKFRKILNIKHPNIEENNNSINILYHCGNFLPYKNIHLILLSIITENLFFTEMRTKQQLGYTVQMNNNKLNNCYYLYQFIQSDKDCDYLENKINDFNNKLKKILNNINITNWINTLKKSLEEKKNKIYDQFIKYNNQILSRQFLFNKNQLLLNQLQNITLKSLINFANTYLFNNNNKTIIKIIKNK